VVWVVLGEGIVYQLINVLHSRLDDSVQKARHQHGTVQLSADVPVKVVAKLPPTDEKSFGQYFGLERSSNLSIAMTETLLFNAFA